MYAKGWDYPMHLGVTEVRARDFIIHFIFLLTIHPACFSDPTAGLHPELPVFGLRLALPPLLLVAKKRRACGCSSQ